MSRKVHKMKKVKGKSEKIQKPNAIFVSIKSTKRKKKGYK